MRQGANQPEHIRHATKNLASNYGGVLSTDKAYILKVRYTVSKGVGLVFKTCRQG